MENKVFNALEFNNYLESLKTFEIENIICLANSELFFRKKIKDIEEV